MKNDTDNRVDKERNSTLLKELIRNIFWKNWKFSRKILFIRLRKYIEILLKLNTISENNNGKIWDMENISLLIEEVHRKFYNNLEGFDEKYFW